MTSIGRMHSSAAGAVLVAGLLAATAAPAKPPANQRAQPGEWIACNEVYKTQSDALEAATTCKTTLSCEEYGRRALVQARVFRMPFMPAAYRGRGGTVVLKVFFDEEGEFIVADVVQSPDPLLAEAAIAAARSMEVQQACYDGRKIPQSGKVTYVFGAN